MANDKNFNGLTGARVDKVKVEVEYAHSHVKCVYTFSDHTALNNWLCSPSIQGKCRVCQIMVKYYYDDEE